MNQLSYLRGLIGFVLLTFLGLARADISEATFTPQGGDKHEPIPAERVNVYVYKPDFKFKIIGVIEAHGMAGGNPSLLDQLDILGQLGKPQPTEKDDIALAMRALKEEAGANGAEGVLILKSVQVRVSENGTERQIKAVAFRVDVPQPSPGGSSAKGADCRFLSLCSLQNGK